MSRNRNAVNWISALIFALVIVVYLVTPFYSVFTVGITGMSLIGIYAVAILPVLLGVVAALAACFLPPLVAILLESAYTLFMVLFMFLGNSVAAGIVNTGLSVPPEWAASMGTVLSLTAMVRPGWGAIVCLVLCVAAIVIDVLANRQERSKPQQTSVFTQNNDFFQSGMF